ncbi:predicted membrane protein [Longilinea arvoryzae]|uniref:Predicted membrane protein n=1 Tax=Longilinea arvoryzae TaxID=360412 RepID=A0A0S7BLP6_9CHLR|nr:vitamin K epoxide reductase family protein [Longilinea arvoryzae]GAP14865.1 predicted membrane protein [Longilinea arvoryzae]
MKINKIWMWSLIIAAIGWIDAVYLIILKYTNNKAMCIQGVGDCWTVNTSRYSMIAGVPVSVLGALAYLAILALYLLERRADFWKTQGVLINFGLSLIGVLFSAYLTYLEIAVIHAICPFCVLSAICMLALLGLNVARLAHSQTDEII